MILGTRFSVFTQGLLTVATGASLACSGIAASEGQDSLSQAGELAEVGENLSCGETRFYTPEPQAEALAQIAELRACHSFKEARLLKKMLDVPRAVWVNGGTPAEAQSLVKKTLKAAKKTGTVPVFVLYNIPFRDCAQFSAGGATTSEEYAEWIDGVARGLGKSEAWVILEPDGLGIIPYVTDWCHPSEADPATAAADRYAQLNAAVDRLSQQAGVRVYLDATHPHWLGVGDISERLVKAGVQRAHGFYINTSNFQATPQIEKYGTWISSCIAFANNADEGGWRLGNYSWCASQYYPASVDDFSTWTQSDAWYQSNLGAAVPSIPFVLDTSRNGQGPWTPPADHPEGDAQDWCNPPNRGLGLLPTSVTGKPLVDAYLWIKSPGESDGQCNRWSPAGSPDPVRGMMDPAAGAWFPEQALELVKFANPKL